MRRVRGSKKSTSRRQSSTNRANQAARQVARRSRNTFKKYKPSRASMEKAARRGRIAAEMGYGAAKYLNETGLLDHAAEITGTQDHLRRSRTAVNTGHAAHNVGREVYSTYKAARNAPSQRPVGGKRRSKRKSSRRKSSRSAGRMRYVAIPKNLLTF